MDRNRLMQGRGARTAPTTVRVALSAAALLILLRSVAPAEAADEELLDKARDAVSLAGVQCDLTDAREVTLASEASAPASHGGHRGGGMGGGMGGGGMGGGGRGGGSHSDSGGDLSGGGSGEKRPSVYEVSCRDGFGFVVLVAQRPAVDGISSDAANGQAPAGPAQPALVAESFNCLELEESSDKIAKKLHCQLDANQDQSAGLKALMKSVNVECEIGDRRSKGHTDEHEFFEVACRNGEDFVLSGKRALRYDGGVRAVSCYALPPDSPLSCKLANAPAILQTLREFVVQKTQGCLPVAQRLVGISPAGNMVFEVGCQSGVAYMVRRAEGESFDTLTACSDKAISNSCMLTNLAQR